MIKKYSLIVLEKAINCALALDENMPLKISAFHGKVIEMVVTPLDVHFYIRFAENTLQLLDECHDKPDTIIHSSPVGLIRLSLLPASQARSLFNDKIRILGDIELGQNVKKLFDELDIDWEGHLSHFTGDVVAYQLGALFRKGLAFQKHCVNRLRQNVTEYLQDELQMFPSGEELDDFFHDIDELSHDVQRLEARIQLLVTKNETD